MFECSWPAHGLGRLCLGCRRAAALRADDFRAGRVGRGGLLGALFLRRRDSFAVMANEWRREREMAHARAHGAGVAKDDRRMLPLGPRRPRPGGDSNKLWAQQVWRPLCEQSAGFEGVPLRSRRARLCVCYGGGAAFCSPRPTWPLDESDPDVAFVVAPEVPPPPALARHGGRAVVHEGRTFFELYALGEHVGYSLNCQHHHACGKGPGIVGNCHAF